MAYKKGTVLKTAFREFRIEEQIGAGGAGVVYAVRDRDEDAYAIKVLDSSKARGSSLKRFRNEIGFCSKHEHQNIISILDTGLTRDDAPFYVMPLYSGTLRRIADRKVSPFEALRIFGEVLDGIEAAHLFGVWHRDLKPENILLSKEGRPVIADFGIAHFEEDAILTAIETKPEERLANFAYAAPEQRMRGRAVTEKADIWALGLILNEVITGEIPYGAGYRRIGQIESRLEYLDSIVEMMLNQDPVRRPSIAELKRELVARGNMALSVQRLDALKGKIIKEDDVDDPFVRNPIVIESVDFQNGVLMFKLSAAPSPTWIAAFQNPRISFSYHGPGPDYYSFHQNVATVRFGGGVAQSVVDSAKNFVAWANQSYAAERKEEQLKRTKEIREEHRRAIEAEEQRQNILSSIRL